MSSCTQSNENLSHCTFLVREWACSYA